MLLRCWGLGLAWKVQFREQKSLILLRTNPNGLKRSRRLLTLSLTVALYLFRIATIYFVQILNLLWPRIANTCEFPLIHRFLTHRSESSVGKSPHRSGCDLRCPKNLWVQIWVTHECTRAQPQLNPLCTVLIAMEMIFVHSRWIACDLLSNMSALGFLRHLSLLCLCQKAWWKAKCL